MHFRFSLKFTLIYRFIYFFSDIISLEDLAFVRFRFLIVDGQEKSLEGRRNVHMFKENVVATSASESNICVNKLQHIALSILC